MKKRKNSECLINPARESLLAFSFYLYERNKNVLQLSGEILRNLDIGFNDGKDINSTIIGNASVSMWFWTLGAYEIVRTISQAEECFADGFMTKIKKLKKQLAIVRMPSTKMEEQGEKSIPVNSNRSADGWDFNSKDLIVGSPENPKSARQLIELYETTLCSLLPSDIIKRHEESYETK